MNYETDIEEYVELMNINPNCYAPIFDTLKLHAKKNKYFDSKFLASQELVFNSGLKTFIAYKLIKVLIFYNVLQEVTFSNGENKIRITYELNFIDNIKEFLFIVNNNITLKSYGRIKKIKKINGIKH